jgi:hypothetical protein
MQAPMPLADRRSFFTAALFMALLCAAWALAGGGPQRRLDWRRLADSPAADLVTHTELVASAAEAQSQGAWFEAPHLAKGPFQRYPVFQFYSFLPYHLPALLVPWAAGPYAALWLALFLSFAAGFVGMAGLARALGLAPPAALLSAAAFTLAPYHLTDLYGRFAYPELFCFGLLPWLFWSLHACASRPRLGAWLACSAAWAALITSHPIFHVWGVPVAALWLLLLKREDRGLDLRLPALAYAMGLALGLFFFAPVLQLGPDFTMARVGGGQVLGGLNPAAVLFHPLRVAVAAVAGSSPRLGLQVGWILLLPFAWLGLRGRRDAAWWLFALAVFLVWSPVDVWPWMGPWKLIQFPYRLLLFAVLFGSLLLGRSLQKAGLKTLAAGLLLLLAWSLPWKVIVPGPLAADVEAAQRANGTEFRTGLYYTLAPDALAQAHAGQDWLKQPGIGAQFKKGPGNVWVVTKSKGGAEVLSFEGGATSVVKLRVAEQGALTVLPFPWYPGYYQVWGNGSGLREGYAQQSLAAPVPAGPAELMVRYRGLGWAKIISWMAALAWLSAAAYVFTKKSVQKN